MGPGSAPHREGRCVASGTRVSRLRHGRCGRYCSSWPPRRLPPRPPRLSSERDGEAAMRKPFDVAVMFLALWLLSTNIIDVLTPREVDVYIIGPAIAPATLITAVLPPANSPARFCDSFLGDLAVDHGGSAYHHAEAAGRRSRMDRTGVADAGRDGDPRRELGRDAQADAARCLHIRSAFDQIEVRNHPQRRAAGARPRFVISTSRRHPSPRRPGRN